ncbi:MAG: DUF716 domain-containing protein [Gemmatimonadetes bacterium]|nr:DUF716 domain-containing protein [Gemmatimonadota bacterium]MBI3566927.1 DUF716 domain-containing protein [Gemmatimonadota bacterium]
MQHETMDMHEVTGDLAGHVGPGIGFMVWAVVWMLALRRDAGPSSPVPLESQRYMPATKMVFAVVAVLLHIPPATWSAMSKAMAWQHMTMFVGYGLTGFVDLLARRGRVGPQATHAALLTAIVVNAVLFVGHGNLAGLEATSHRLLLCLLAATAASVALELLRPSSLARWLRAGTMFATGLWFATIGWVLYLSGWELDDPTREMTLYTLWGLTVFVAAGVTLAARARSARPAA